MELSILCNCEISLVVFIDDKLYEYSTGDPRALLEKYCNKAVEPHERYSNEDYYKRFNKSSPKKGRKGKNDSSDDDDDDELSPQPRSNNLQQAHIIPQAYIGQPAYQLQYPSQITQIPLKAEVFINHPGHGIQAQQVTLQPVPITSVINLPQAEGVSRPEPTSNLPQVNTQKGLKIEVVPPNQQSSSHAFNQQEVSRNSTGHNAPLQTPLSSISLATSMGIPTDTSFENSPMTNILSPNIFNQSSSESAFLPPIGVKRGRSGDDLKRPIKKKKQDLSISVPAPPSSTNTENTGPTENNFTNGESATPLLFSDPGMSPITPLTSTISATNYDALWKEKDK